MPAKRDGPAEMILSLQPYSLVVYQMKSLTGA
jgi:hypothetical protein